MSRIWPEMDDQTVAQLTKVLRGGRWAIAQNDPEQSSWIDAAEVSLAQKFGYRHAVTTCNGSAAILTALQALRLVPGSPVIVPACTWVACGTAVLRAGLEPVFVDVAEDRPVWDPTDQEIPEDISAILAVHLYASRVDLAKVAAVYPGVPIIEDRSHLPGADGIFGATMAVQSFQASKILTCGEGGAVLTNDADLAYRVEALRADGRVRDNEDPHGVRPAQMQGANFAMSEISAALLLDQLDRYQDQCARRAVNAQHFAASLGNQIFADQAVLEAGAFHGIPVMVSYKQGIVDEIVKQTGVQCLEIYPPVPFSPLWDTDSGEPDLDNAVSWEDDDIVVIPHEVFLNKTVTEAVLRILIED